VAESVTICDGVRSRANFSSTALSSLLLPCPLLREPQRCLLQVREGRAGVEVGGLVDLGLTQPCLLAQHLVKMGAVVAAAELTGPQVSQLTLFGGQLFLDGSV
jgi:hypothetical protein